MNDLLFWTILFLLLVSFYMICSTKRKQDFQIIQTPIRSLTDSMLHEKYPILVHDRVSCMSSLLRGVFRFQYLFSEALVNRIDSSAEDFSTKVKTRFLLLRNREEGESHLRIGLHESSMISMTADPHNVLILPAGWYFNLDAPDSWELLALNDLSHRLFFAH